MYKNFEIRILANVRTEMVYVMVSQRLIWRSLTLVGPKPVTNSAVWVNIKADGDNNVSNNIELVVEGNRSRIETYIPMSMAPSR